MTDFFERIRSDIKSLTEGDLVDFPQKPKTNTTVPIRGAKVYNYRPRHLDTSKMDAFTLAYIEAMLWTEGESLQEQGIEYATIDNLAPKTIEEAIEDCESFQTQCGELLADIDPAQAGHDFWLTRNRHGAGFWDRGLGKVGEDLTEIANTYGEINPYVGDDGLIYTD